MPDRDETIETFKETIESRFEATHSTYPNAPLIGAYSIIIEYIRHYAEAKGIDLPDYDVLVDDRIKWRDE